MLIGKKLKQLRKERKVSLRELSDRSGVQTATLSRMENLKMTGTLESHNQIARALGVSLVELYSDIHTDEKKVDKKTPQSPGDVFIHSDKSSYEILTSKVLSKKMMPILLKIEPQGNTNVEQNQFGTEKFIFVLDGKIDVKIDSQGYSLLKHNTLYFDASLKHQFINIGKVTAHVVCVTTPVAL